MKNSLKDQFILAAIFIFIAAFGGMNPSWAQENHGSKIIKLKLQQNNNGTIQTIDTTMTVDANFDVKKFLQSRGFNNDDLPPISDEKGKKVIIINETRIDNDSSSVTRDKLEEKDGNMDERIKLNIDSVIGINKNENVILLTEDIRKGGTKEQEYEVKEINPDGKRVTIKRVSIVIANTEAPAEEKSGRVTIPGTKGTQLEINGLTFFPNPSEGKFTLKFSLAERSATTVRILDITGKKVYEESLPNFPGNYEKTIDISKNGTGTYFIEVIQGDRSVVKKVMIQ